VVQEGARDFGVGGGANEQIVTVGVKQCGSGRGLSRWAARYGWQGFEVNYVKKCHECSTEAGREGAESGK